LHPKRFYDTRILCLGNQIHGQLSEFAVIDILNYVEKLYIIQLLFISTTGNELNHWQNIILFDMKRERLIAFDGRDIKTPVVHHSERGVPTDEEAALLFPSDFDSFRRPWNREDKLPVHWK
jgi:hypothetical protein